MSDDAYLQPSPYIADKGELIGLDPRSIDVGRLRALGHPESPIRAIRAKCIDCAGGSEVEVRKCVAHDCPLWPFRMGKNVFHSRASDKRRADAAAFIADLPDTGD